MQWIFPNRVNLITDVTRRWHSATMAIKLCKTWKFQRMKEWLQQHLVIDEADMLFIVSEEKCFRDMTKDGNAEVMELENLNNDNESDGWHRLMSWSRLCHCVLEEDVLTA